MEELNPVQAENTQQVDKVQLRPDRPKRTAADWVRDMRMSADVNKTTVGVDTDRVTPDLMLATSRKLLGISRREVEPDPKDSLQFQRFYGPAEYFSEHILRDSGKLGRNLLWKATNRGNLDFMQTGSLDTHVSDVFYNSKLAQMVDGSSPLELMDSASKLSRLGEGGISDVDSAPTEMRLVQPSFYGFVDPVRCYAKGTELMTERGWKKIEKITVKDVLACLVDGELEWHHPESMHHYETDGQMMYYCEDEVGFFVTEEHRMYVRTNDMEDFGILYATELFDYERDVRYFDVICGLDGKSDIRTISAASVRQWHESTDVYCPTVPGGLVYCKYKHGSGFWCGNSPESLRVGLDAYLAKGVLKGSDGKLYRKMINAHTGKEELVDSVTAAKSVITTPDMMEAKTKSIYALGGKTGARIVRKEDVDYYMPRSDEMFSTAANMVPMPNGVKEMRLLMGCLHPQTNLLTVDASGRVAISQAKDTSGRDSAIPGSTDEGTECLYGIRNTVAKFPKTRKWFRKVTLLSGRTLITSCDHRWYVQRGDTDFQLINADKLKKGDRVLRSAFQRVPMRKTFVNGAFVNADVAYLLGCAVRTLHEVDTGKYRITFPEDAKPRIEAAASKLKIDSPVFYTTAGLCCMASVDARFNAWLKSGIGLQPATRMVPSEMLSAGTAQAAAFLDAYTADKTRVAVDAEEDYWVLGIENATVRDALAFLWTRVGTDTLYRDSVQRDGSVEYALKLIPMEADKGDVIVDAVKCVQEVASAGIMVDVDVDDNLFATANGIITHNSKYAMQAVPLEQREAPLVRTLDEASGKDMPSIIGKYLGAQYAKRPGHVAAVRKDRIDVIYDDGTKARVPLYQNFPMNAKGYITNTPRVKAGQSFGEGDLLASSNYTDDKGVAAIGKPLRAAWISWKGGTYEDGLVISESCAKKLTSTTMYPTAIDLDKTVSLGKRNYQLWKPSEYSKEQLESLDDDGIVKPGTVLHSGDPMILAVQTSEPSPGTMGRRILTDVSETWGHDHPGVVTDVVKTRKGVKVYATVTAPVEVGDKLSGCYDDRTEIFTDRGFVLFKDLTDNDKVAVLHPDGTATFEIPRARQVSEYKGCMIHNKTRRIDFAVTPNHDMAFAPKAAYDKGDTRLVKRHAADIYGKRIYMRLRANFDATLARTGDEWTELPLPYVGYPEHMLKPGMLVHRFRRTDLAKFLGIYLAEGHCGKFGRGYWMRVSQYDTTEEGRTRCAQIAQVLTSLGVDWHYYDHQYFMINNLALWNYVCEYQNSYEKAVPKSVFATWTKQEMQLLLEWFYMGDGEKGIADDGTDRCATVSRQLADDLQRLYILVGKQSNVRCTKARNARSGKVYRISSSYKEFIQIGQDKNSWCIDDAYDGMVYCVTTSTGIVLTRRNGVTIWNGQSYGNKGTVSMILPDDEMPQDKDGNAMDILFSPLGIITRCYDEETEFLTQDGWKTGDKVLDGDLIWSYDPRAGSWDWSEQTSPMWKTDYEGKVIGARNADVDFAVTTGHRVWVTLDPEQPFAEDLVDNIVSQECWMLGMEGLPHRIAAEDWYIDPDYAGTVYCPTVVTGYVAARRYGLALCMGNTNPSQLHEALLGKVAHKTGKPEVVPAFYKGDLYQYVNDRLKQAKVSATDDLVNPETSKPLTGILNGYSYIYKLKHLAESKESERGTGLYTAEGTPALGSEGQSKRYGMLEQSALVGHGVQGVINDAHLVRGQSNADFWRSIRTGDIPTMPGEPLVHKKFFAHLQGAGVNVRKTPKGVSVFALTNGDVNELAGPRELRSRDTYEAKNFRPIDGGLFGQDVFGINGDQWGYIQLDTPLPNPVMEDPLARLLNIPLSDFAAVAAGTKEVNGMKSAADIKERLEHVNLEAEAAKAKREFKDSTKSRRDAALKRYVAIERMRRQGVQPSEYMLDRIPVLPPVYRPVSSHGGLTMVADSNYLYAQLLDARDDAREAKDLPAEYQRQAQENLYKKWKELTGLYDPENPKLKNKNVKGLLAWAIGGSGTSPKFSSYQRRLLGNAVDTVGRGVIVSNPRMKLNEVGIPEKMAYSIFGPFVSRKLVKEGYSPVDALKLVKAGSPKARAALVEVMQDHPVQLNRAPTLHKLNILGLSPKLVSGHAIHIHPSICPVLAADFDGDTVANITRIAIDREILEKKIKENGENNLTKLDKAVYCMYSHGRSLEDTTEKGAESMLGKNDYSMFVNAIACLYELPTVEGSEVKKSDTVTEWDVQPGYLADTLDPVTGLRVQAPITKVSRHTGLTMYNVKFSVSGSYEHIVTASEDHSLIAYNPDTLTLEKTKPMDSLGRCVPRLCNGTAGVAPEQARRYIDLGGQLPASYKLGMFLGLMLGDGWIDSNNCTRLACCDKSLQEYIADLMTVKNSPIPLERDSELWTYDKTEDEQRFSKKPSSRFTFYTGRDLAKAIRDLIGCGALNKCIPAASLFCSPAHLIGILMGLLATDGSLSYSVVAGRKAAHKAIAINTISPYLRDSIQELCWRLGIRTSVTPYRGPKSQYDCFAVCLSLEDTVRCIHRHPTLFRIPMQSKQETLEKITLEVEKGHSAETESGTSSHTVDIVPLPSGLFCELTFAGVLKGYKYFTARSLTRGYVSRDAAKRVADVLRKTDWTKYYDLSSIHREKRTGHTPKQAQELVEQWIALVENDQIGWEVVTEVTPSTCTEGWDCTVPGPYTFTLASGTVVQDTVNIHVPVSDEARRETYERMFPDRNLIAMRNRKIAFKPEKEYIQGLYVATRMKEGERPRIFDTLEDARRAQREGTLDVDDPIIIKGN